jgi:1-acyl-sn-glycerol-3-phosphate acyltransferase
MIARLRGILLLTFWFGAIGVIAPFVIILGIVTKNENFIYTPVRFFVRVGLALVRVRVEVSGLERLDPKQTYLFTPNHQSMIEAPLVVTYLGRNPAFLAKKELFKYPIFGFGMRVIGVVPVDRGNSQAAIESARKGAENLRKGKPYVVYPEGTRTQRGRLLPFKKGAFMMAIQAGVPVVPVTISGSAAIMPKGEVKVTPGTVWITVHEPISTEGFNRDNIAELMETTRARILSALSEEEKAAAL